MIELDVLSINAPHLTLNPKLQHKSRKNWLRSVSEEKKPAPLTQIKQYFESTRSPPMPVVLVYKYKKLDLGSKNEKSWRILTPIIFRFYA